MRIAAVLILVAVVACGSSCVKGDWIQNTLVTADVTGAWAGTYGRPGSSGAGNEIRLELEQQGSRVNGTYHLLQSPSSGVRQTGSIDGTLTGDVFTFRQPTASRTGEVTVNGDEMNGRLDLVGSVQLFLRRISASPSPR